MKEMNILWRQKVCDFGCNVKKKIVDTNLNYKKLDTKIFLKLYCFNKILLKNKKF